MVLIGYMYMYCYNLNCFILSHQPKFSENNELLDPERPVNSRLKFGHFLLLVLFFKFLSSKFLLLHLEIDVNFALVRIVTCIKIINLLVGCFRG